jgi:hypothetical protein
MEEQVCFEHLEALNYVSSSLSDTEELAVWKDELAI